MAVAININDLLAAQWQGTNAWVDGGAQVNPGGGAVVADTGPLAAGAYLIAVHWRATVAAAVNIQQRNAANGATVAQIDRDIGARGHDDCVVGSKIVLGASERIRVVNEGAIVGTLRASIVYVQSPATP